MMLHTGKGRRRNKIKEDDLLLRNHFLHDLGRVTTKKVKGVTTKKVLAAHHCRVHGKVLVLVRVMEVIKATFHVVV